MENAFGNGDKDNLGCRTPPLVFLDSDNTCESKLLEQSRGGKNSKPVASVSSWEASLKNFQWPRKRL